MSDQFQQPAAPRPIQISLNGGAFPSEDGTWRVVCWISGIVNETEAGRVSQWLGNLVRANIKQEPPPEAPPPAPVNGP